MFHPDVTSISASAPAGLPKDQLLPIVLGGAVTLLGLVVISGWLAQIQVMVEFRAGLVAMVFNTALCFALAGGAVLLQALAHRPMPMLQHIVGAGMLVLCALILADHIQDTDLGIDWAFLHLWLRDGNVRPGRMAPNTAIGFMLVGACLVLMSRIASKLHERLFQILVFCVGAIGLTGLVGYATAPDQIFGWTRSARMALHTGVGMVALALALWVSWYRMRGARTRFFGLDERIGFKSAAILSVSTLTAGLTGFVFHQAILEDSLREKLQFRLDGQRRVIYTVLTEARTATHHASRDRQLLAHAQALSGGSANDVDMTMINADMNDLLGSGFHGVALYALDGRLLLQAGEQATSPGPAGLALPPRDNDTATLSWEDQIMLDTSTPLLRNGVAFARLDLRQRLPILQTQLFDLRGLGRTGEIVLCAGRPTTLVCLPSGRQ